jgi:tRNA G18 (ribose-2'-O)-methylase SpoU
MSKSIFLVLQNIRSLYNVGAIFRSADAFGVERIYLCGYTAAPVKCQMEKVAKTALGAEKSVPWEYHQQTTRLVKKLKEQGIAIVALEKTKNPIRKLRLQSYQPKFPLALIVGNEKTGITKPVLKLADKIVYIPMQGIKESLNVAVAASIAMYELTRGK